jgi:hypothetical protein
MEGLGVLLLLLWLLAGLVNAGKRRRQASHPSRPRRPSPGPRPQTRPQRSGSVLEVLRGELERLKAEAEAAQRGRSAEGRQVVLEFPGAEELEGESVEELEVLEVEPEVQSLEEPVLERARARVDQDEQAEAIVRRRLQAAEARNRALSPADHRAFDRSIRAGQAVPSAAAARRRRQPSLRDAIVWREVLGPPVALRSDDRMR